MISLLLEIIDIDLVCPRASYDLDKVSASQKGSRNLSSNRFPRQTIVVIVQREQWWFEWRQGGSNGNFA